TATIVRRNKRWILLLRRLVVRFWDATKYYFAGLYNHMDDDHCFLLSAGIAFNVLYCIIPLSLLIYDVFSFILRSNEKATIIIVQYLSTSIPIPEYRSLVERWLNKKLSGAMGLE